MTNKNHSLVYSPTSLHLLPQHLKLCAPPVKHGYIYVACSSHSVTYSGARAEERGGGGETVTVHQRDSLPLKQLLVSFQPPKPQQNKK